MNDGMFVVVMALILVFIMCSFGGCLDLPCFQDPQVNWISEIHQEYLLQGKQAEFEFGFRDDGVVVWREVDNVLSGE